MLRVFRILFVLVLVTKVAVAQTSQPASAPAAPKKVYFWCTMWPDLLGKFDPETDTIVDKIKLKRGLWYNLTNSMFGDRFIVVTGQQAIIEEVDRRQKTTVAEHSFVEKDYIIRIEQVKEVPLNTHWYVRINKVKLVDDHYEKAQSEWLYYNRAEKKIEKRMKELPEQIRRGSVVSPDGKKWHIFGKDIAVLDPVTMKEEGKIELSKPLYTGMGALRVDVEDDFFDRKNPDTYRFMYSMSDPVKKNRSLIGMIDVDMKNMKIASMDEWGWNPGVWGLRISHDKKFAAAQLGGRFGGGGDDGKTKLAIYDLTQKAKKVCEAEHTFRPRRWLMGISPDGKKVYVGGAGNDLEVFDDKLQRLKQVWLDADLGGNFTEIEE